MPSSEKEPILQLQEVTKSFGNLTAVNHCSFGVERNWIIGLIGPNGAGKTTLFNLITGSYTADAGDILFKDQPITSLKPYQIAEKGIGKTFQITRVFSKMTLMENLIVAARVRNKDERALELLELAGLIDLKGDYASDLSYGQQKLLALIRVLMFDPDLILLDEPAAGINPTMQNKIMDRIHKLKDDGKTFLIIEVYQSGYRVELKSSCRANCNTGTAVGTSFFIAKHILAERLDYYSVGGQILNALIIVFLLTAQL